MTRAHFFRPILEMVGHGVSGDDTKVGLLTGATVAIYSPGSTTLIGDSLFTTDSGVTTLVNPFVCVSGIIDFYLNVPQRVDIGVTPQGGTETIIPAIDVAVYNLSLLATSFAPLNSVFSGVQSAVTVPGALVVNKDNPIDTTSGSLAYTLANASAAGQVVSVEKVDSSVNTVTVTLNLRGTPASTITLVWPHETLTMLSKADGSWWPIAGHKTKSSLDAAYAPIIPPYTTVAASGATQTITLTNTESVFNIVLTANCTITLPAVVAGKRFYLRLLQDATGSRTGTWSGSVRWPGGTAPTLTTTANSSDVFTFTGFDNSAWSAAFSQDVR